MQETRQEIIKLEDISIIGLKTVIDFIYSGELTLNIGEFLKFHWAHGRCVTVYSLFQRLDRGHLACGITLAGALCA